MSYKMPTASFTARIDADLKTELEAIARFEDRGASWLVNQASCNYVEERIATRELLRAGLALIERRVEGVAPGAVHEWLSDDDERAFPGALPKAE
jgi:predicted transcriptional regulator